MVCQNIHSKACKQDMDEFLSNIFTNLTASATLNILKEL